ncbi:alpha/beta hydrolase [Paludisphaera borealis]|uniref:Alpha/beta hydrolase n=1 Tax=Paludisphaera borealis TaxID=1387353 RepID=A0A1U7CYE4_9BACT|nr:alpha/beta hydrolase [Paludisphaera borealis]APW63955.1 alpha/beta hydrolase [Paludisphaera borealis]
MTRRKAKMVLGVIMIAGVSALVGPARGGGPDSASEVVKLWPNGVPDAKGTDPDKDVPTLSVFLPKPGTAKGSGVVVCPGGGYGMLAMEHEGREVAEWLNSLGVAAFVLKYRLAPKYHHPAMLHDVNRAIRVVRHGGSKWGVDPNRIALLGFSAGGHLASTGGTHFDAGKPDAKDPVDRVSSRPDRLILAYPVIAMATPYTHGGSNKNLLGDNPPAELVRSLSNETQVTADTPPTFLAHTNEDAAVPAENSLLFALALRKAKVPLELHIFEKGQHGLGLGTGAKQFKIGPNPAFQAWPKLCETWLKGQGFLTKPAAPAAP